MYSDFENIVIEEEGGIDYRLILSIAISVIGIIASYKITEIYYPHFIYGLEGSDPDGVRMMVRIQFVTGFTAAIIKYSKSSFFSTIGILSALIFITIIMPVPISEILYSSGTLIFFLVFIFPPYYISYFTTGITKQVIGKLISFLK